MAEWTTEDVRDIITGLDETGRTGLRGEKFDRWLTAHDAEVIREYLEKRQIPVVRIETSDELRPILDAAMKEARAKALEEAAEEFASRLPDGTGNGRAYNSWRVAELLRARAAAIRGEQP